MKLSALLFIFCSLSPLFGIEEKRDPFGEYVDQWKPPEPREVFYWSGDKRVEKNEIMVKSLVNLFRSLDDVPLVSHGLIEMPQTKLTDKVYDISAWFPNCIGEQWVYYNDTSDYLIANASHQLRTSVNEYVHRMLSRSLQKVRLSMTYLVVDGNVPLNLEDLRGAKYRKVMSFSSEFRPNEEVSIIEGGRQISAEATNEGLRCDTSVILKLTRDNELEVEISALFESGEEKIVNVGITEGNERGVMMIKLEWLDMKGNVLSPLQNRNSYKYTHGGHYLNYSYYLFRKTPDFTEDLISNKMRLIVPPKLEFFDKDDITFSIKEFMILQGVKLEEDDWVIYDAVTERLIAYCSEEAFEQIGELVSFMGVRAPRSASVMTLFYEVDAADEIERWDLLNVLASKPVLLGSISYLQQSGNRIRLSSSLGNTSLERIVGGSDDLDEQIYEIDVSFLGREIKAKLELLVHHDKPTFVEVHTDLKANRAIVMMIVTKTPDRIYPN